MSQARRDRELATSGGLVVALLPLVVVAFAVGVVPLVSGTLSGALGLSRGSRTSVSLEETLIKAGLRLIFGAGMVWLLLWM
jgi:hypothetical protein